MWVKYKQMFRREITNRKKKKRKYDKMGNKQKKYIQPYNSTF